MTDAGLSRYESGESREFEDGNQVDAQLGMPQAEGCNRLIHAAACSAYPAVLEDHGEVLRKEGPTLGASRDLRDRGPNVRHLTILRPHLQRRAYFGAPLSLCLSLYIWRLA